MQRLVTGRPEPLTSRFRVTADLVAGVLSRPDGPTALKHLLRTNHDPEPRRRQHRRRAIAVYRSLEAAGVAERLRDADGRCIGVRVGSLVEGEEERSALRFSAPLMTFAIEMIAVLDRDDPAYVVDVVSVVEAVLEDPRQVLGRPARRGQGGRGGPPQGRGRPLRGAHGTARDDHLAAAARRRARRGLRDLPQPPPVADDRAVAQVDPARDAGERRQLRHVRAPLPAGAQRGPRAALPHRRLAHPRPVAARRRVLAGPRGRRRVARRADPGHRRHPARRVDVARRSTRSTTTWHPTHPTAVRAWPPAAWRTAVRTAAFGWVELLAARSYGALADRSGWDETRLGRGHGAVLGGVRRDRDRRRRPLVAVRRRGRGARALDRDAASDGPVRRRRVALRGDHRPRAGPHGRRPDDRGSTSSDRGDTERAHRSPASARPDRDGDGWAAPAPRAVAVVAIHDSTRSSDHP